MPEYDRLSIYVRLNDRLSFTQLFPADVCDSNSHGL